MIHDPILRAVAKLLGVDVDGDMTDCDVRALVDGRATVKYGLDEAGEVAATVARPDCHFCMDGPVCNAGSWVTSEKPSYAPCPRCGKVYGS